MKPQMNTTKKQTTMICRIYTFVMKTGSFHKITSTILCYYIFQDIFEAQVGNIKAGQNVVIVDDLLATGGEFE